MAQMKMTAMRGTIKNGEDRLTIRTPYRKGSRDVGSEEMGDSGIVLCSALDKARMKMRQT
jgi:hypothetical protein